MIPTSRRRRTITSTDLVQGDPERLRQAGCETSLEDLVVLGAERVRADREAVCADAERRRDLRRAFIGHTTDAPIDVDAALSVRDGGWTRRLPG